MLKADSGVYFPRRGKGEITVPHTLQVRLALGSHRQSHCIKSFNVFKKRKYTGSLDLSILNKIV